jgi:hypothetical protein
MEVKRAYRDDEVGTGAVDRLPKPAYLSGEGGSKVGMYRDIPHCPNSVEV